MEFKAQLKEMKTMADGGSQVKFDVFDTTPLSDSMTLYALCQAKAVVKMRIEETDDGDGT
jgi:hypothetical protein